VLDDLTKRGAAGKPVKRQTIEGSMCLGYET
jgi:hypothetical protein